MKGANLCNTDLNSKVIQKGDQYCILKCTSLYLF